MKWVYVHGCCHSPFLVNWWWTRYLGRHPIEFHGLHGCKLTLCLVLIVQARKMGQRLNLVARLKMENEIMCRVKAPLSFWLHIWIHR